MTSVSGVSLSQELYTGDKLRGGAAKKTPTLGIESKSGETFDIEGALKADISIGLEGIAKSLQDLGHFFTDWTKGKESLVVQESDVAIQPKEDSKGPATPLKTMSKIEYAARKFFARFSKSEADKLTDYHLDHISHRAYYADVSGNPAGLSQPYQPRADKVGEFMTIRDPKTQMVAPQDLQKPFSDKRGVARHAVNEQKLHEQVPSKQIEGVGKMKAYRFEEGKPVKGAVTPTSYFLGQEDEAAKNHLMNTYVVKVDKQEVALIRSGKIDTQEKADEFVALLEQIHTEFSKGETEQGETKTLKMRVVSHQLNSFDMGIESKMIDNQHRWIAYANDKLKDKADLVHINTPSNRYYHTTKMVRETLGALGLGGVAKFIEKHVLTGERLSQEQNLDSWGTYVKWTMEDLEKGLDSVSQDVSELEFYDEELEGKMTLPQAFNWLQDAMTPLTVKTDAIKKQIEEDFKKIQQAKACIIKEEGSLKRDKFLSEETRETFKTDIAHAKHNIPVYENRIRENRTKMREALIEQRNHLKAFDTRAKKVAGISSKKLTLLEPVSLMLAVLDSQLGIEDPSVQGKSPSRGMELLSIQLLNDKLGVTVAMNCKSGLDRTGFLFAVKLAMTQMGKLPASAGMATDPFEMTQQWDTVTLALNKKMTGMDAVAFKAWIDGAGAGDLLDDQGQVIDKKLVRQVIEFRKVVLDNLIRVGLPITKTSTGLEGLKWSPGTMGENLIPLNFLPSHVMVGREMRPLVNYDPKTGEPTGVTIVGKQLLTKFSGLRGS